MKKHWFNYDIINLLSTDEDDSSNENCDMKQNIDLSDYFIFDYFHMFTLTQFEI